MSNHVLKSGTKIGDSFEIQELLGSGGFGITYKAWDTEFERVVAIKEYFPFDLAERSGDIDTVIPRDPSKKDDFEDGLNRFVEEGRTLAKFADERIVRATRFINANGTAYMVMEYQEGCSLSTFLANNDGPLSERQLLNIFVPIMQGLDKVHRANILHRDLKPDNIYIRTDGTPLLLDFGAARQKVVGKTRSLTSVLSPGYAPFEQYHSRGNQGPWTDIYALGATLYYCATGKNPEDATARIAARNDDEPDPMPPAVQIGSRMYSEDLLSTIDWMLSLDTSQRPQSLSEVLARLPDLEPEAVTKIVEQRSEYVATEMIKDSNQVSRKPIVWYSAIGLSLVLLIVLGLVLWPRSVPPTQTDRVAKVEAGRLVEDKSKQEEAAQARLAEERKRQEELARRKAQKQAAQPTRHALTVIPNPQSAQVRVLNIQTSYAAGMLLTPGQYHIEVSALGYETQRKWIQLNGNQTLHVRLSRPSVAAPSYAVLGPYKIRIYVSDSNPGMIKKAHEMKSTLVNQLKTYGVKPRFEVGIRSRDFFRKKVEAPKGFEIRYEPQDERFKGERVAAEQLHTVLQRLYPKNQFKLVPVKNRTPNPNFISIFFPLR